MIITISVYNVKSNKDSNNNRDADDGSDDDSIDNNHDKDNSVIITTIMMIILLPLISTAQQRSVLHFVHLFACLSSLVLSLLFQLDDEDRFCPKPKC